MALPTLDATFASSADLPRKQMLAKWLVEELGETGGNSSVLVSGLSETQYNGLYAYDEELNEKPSYRLNENIYIYWDGGAWILEYAENGNTEIVIYSNDDVNIPWIAVWELGTTSGTPVVAESPAPSPLSNYYSLPERYLWAKIAVAAGAPKTEADYISLPRNYAWSDIYNTVSGDIAQSTIIVSGAGSTIINGTYTYRGEFEGRPYYNLVGQPDNSSLYAIYWDGTSWTIIGDDESLYQAIEEDVAYPWMAISWSVIGGISPIPTVIPQTPNHTDWSENVALGHIAAAYRGDTGNPANLATYIDWPWRYKVASIIQAL